MDEFTEYEEQGWFSRIMESIKSVAIGGVMFLVAFPLLFANEGCAVKTAKSLEEGAAAVVSVKSNAKVDPQYEGKLVHMTGNAVAQAPLKDPALGVQASAIKLSRNVEMYQWVETKKTKTKKKAGGKKVKKTTYSYKKDWADSFHDSSHFKKKKGHTNPGDMPYKKDEWHSKSVKFGAFDLPETLVSKIHKYEDFPVNKEMLAALPADLKHNAKISGNSIYVGHDPKNPIIGDLRITYKVVKSDQPVSIVAQQMGSSFTKYQTEAGNAIALLDTGKVTADKMFADAQAANTMMTWIVRIAGMAMMFFGIMMVFKPLVVVADVVPLVGDMLELGIGLFAGLAAFGLSFLTISIAWIFYRPLIGIPLLLLAIGGLAAAFVMGKKKKAAKAAAPA